MNSSWFFAVLLLQSPGGLAADANSASGTGDPYVISREIIAGGGGVAAADGFSLVGTIGQSSAAPAVGGAFELVGGFHATPLSLAPQPDALFSNGFEVTP